MLGRRIRAVRVGRLLDGTGAEAIHNAVVVLDERGRILFAGDARDPAASALSDLPPDAVLDVPGGTVLPGLIDSHVHLTFGVGLQAVEDGVRQGRTALHVLVEQIRTDGDGARAVRAAGAAQAALGAGVTTLRDCGAAGRAVHMLRDLVALGAVTGPRILVSGRPVTTRGGHCWWLGGEADTRDEALALVREQIRDGADFVKVMATGGGMTPGSNRVRAQYPVETLAAIVDDAHRLGRQVAAHAHGVEGIARAAEAGVRIVEHCSWNTEDGLHLDLNVASLLASRGVFVGDTIGGATSIFAKRGKPADALPADATQRFAIFRQLREMGVQVVTSSDAMYTVTPFEDFPWAIVASSRYGGLTPAQAVHAATGLAAEAIGFQDEIGTLSPGKRGDLLLVEGDVTADVEALSRTRWVLRDGVVVAGNGHVRAPGVY